MTECAGIAFVPPEDREVLVGVVEEAVVLPAPPALVIDPVPPLVVC